MKQIKRTTAILWGLTGLALGAGIMAGIVVARVAATRIEKSSPRGDGFAETLHLSDQQRHQMRDIWEATHVTALGASQDAQDAQHDRDNAVFSILNSDQKLQYDRLTKLCAQKMESLKSKRDEAVKTAIAQTRQMLSPEQRQQYETLIRDRLGKATPGIATGRSDDPSALASATDWQARMGLRE